MIEESKLELVAQTLIALAVLIPLGAISVYQAAKGRPFEAPPVLALAAGAIIGWFFTSRQTVTSTRNLINGQRNASYPSQGNP